MAYLHVHSRVEHKRSKWEEDADADVKEEEAEEEKEEEEEVQKVQKVQKGSAFHFITRTNYLPRTEIQHPQFLLS